MRVSVLLLVAVLSMPASSSRAAWCPLSRSACGIEGLPSSVVEGIIVVESGSNPWVLRVNLGKGYSFYPRTRGEARRFLAVALALTDNVDIGLMQINWRTWKGEILASGLRPYDLLEPEMNLKVGCLILAEALATRGTFEARLGRYHTRQRERGRWYARRVLAAAREVEGANK